MKVAVIGCGVMGSAIARRLLATGTELTVFDIDPARTRELCVKGALSADSPAHAGANVDHVITSLNSADIVESAVFGDQGIADTATPAKTLIDMSSINAGRTAILARRLRAQTGMAWIDAPLSGGAPAVAHGALTLMLGGEKADVENCRPLFELLSTNFTHFGPAGSGQTVKLINQILCAAHFMAVAEAVAFADAHGVDAALIPAALAGGRADSRIMQEYMAKMATRDFSPTGRIDNMLKDLETVQASAQSKRLGLPVTSLIADLHRILVAGGFGPADSAEYMRLFAFDGQG